MAVGVFFGRVISKFAFFVFTVDAAGGIGYVMSMDRISDMPTPVFIQHFFFISSILRSRDSAHDSGFSHGWARSQGRINDRMGQRV